MTQEQKEQQPHYGVNLRLTLKDKQALDQIRKKKHTIIEVFRKGLEAMKEK